MHRQPYRPCLVGLACLGLMLLVGCSTPPARPEPAQVRTVLLAKLPGKLADREGWARDIEQAFTTLELEPSESNLCAVLAVIEQESTYRVDPPVPNLGRIAIDEIKRRAATHGVPALVVDMGLQLRAPDGRRYEDHLRALKTEREMSALFEEITARLPLGSGRLFAGLNPVRTGGPMQVSIAFAEAHAGAYPHADSDSIRHEVFTRRGGLYFGILHLLGYPADYDRPLYRFADFNAGWHASRNAAFQRAAAIASGIKLVYDGDLLVPGAPMDRPGATESALRSIAARLDMDAGDIRADLRLGARADFTRSRLYRRVFAIADAKGAGNPVPRARVPDIDLKSPKISRKLTTAWFADRVNTRWNACMRR